MLVLALSIADLVKKCKTFWLFPPAPKFWPPTSGSTQTLEAFKQTKLISDAS